MSYNQYGLDSDYFKEKLGLIVRDADNYTPAEMLRSLKALSDVVQHQADQFVISQGKWADMPAAVYYRCPDEARGKRIAVKRRNGDVDLVEHATNGPYWHPDNPELDLVAFMLLEGAV